MVNTYFNLVSNCNIYTACQNQLDNKLLKLLKLLKSQR